MAAFVVGFWLLDVANNMTQGPCRALLADLTGKDHRRNRVANAYFSLSMAVGNVLGFATGSYSGWFKIFPFTVTSACNADCANLKSAFFLDIAFIVITTYISISVANELPLNHGPSHLCEEMPKQSSHAQEAFFWQLFGTFRYLSGPVWVILLVTALTWFGWFPFLLFDTNWMGREIYGGKPNEGHNYNRGVRIGAFDLMLNSGVLGITSVFVEMCRKLGAGVITYSVPCALISSHVESLGLGQGLSMGVLNVVIVIPQCVALEVWNSHLSDDSLAFENRLWCFLEVDHGISYLVVVTHHVWLWQQLQPLLVGLAILAIRRAGADKSRGQ
ncbi:hypothetical protein ACSBR1_029948 [Camellia fascicularis]